MRAMVASDMGISIRDAMIPVAEGGSFFDAVRGIGVSAVELEIREDLTCPAFPAESIKDVASIRSLRKAFADEAMRISALLLATDFSGPCAESHVAWATRAVRAAAELGVPVIRIDPLTADRTLATDVVRERFTRHASQLLEQTRGSAVELGMENHGPLANDPAFIDGVFASIPDPRLGLTLDTGNFYWFGFSLDELYDLIDRFAARAKHTHIKSINYPPELRNQRRPVGIDYGKYCCSLDEGNLDLRRIVGSLRRAGYRRNLCIENESLGKHPPAMRAKLLERDARRSPTRLPEITIESILSRTCPPAHRVSQSPRGGFA